MFKEAHRHKLNWLAFKKIFGITNTLILYGYFSKCGHLSRDIILCNYTVSPTTMINIYKQINTHHILWKPPLYESYMYVCMTITRVDHIAAAYVDERTQRHTAIDTRWHVPQHQIMWIDYTAEFTYHIFLTCKIRTKLAAIIKFSCFIIKRQNRLLSSISS